MDTDTNQSNTAVVEPQTDAATDTQADHSTKAETQESSPVDTWKNDPKVKEHFENEIGTRYKDYDQLKQSANQFAQVQNDPRYREWVQSLNAPKKEEPFKLTDEEHTAMLGDPNKASEIIARAAQRAADEKYGPQIEQLRKEAQFAKASTELADCVKRHPEFVDLDKNGHIMPVLQQYPGISFDDALAIAKQKTGWVQKAAALEAAEIVRTKKAAMTEKPGTSRAAKGKKSFASREDAMVYVMEQARLGNDVDEDDLDIS